MINSDLEKELLKNIDIARQSAKNSFDIMFESYLEVTERLDFLTYIIINNKKK